MTLAINLNVNVLYFYLFFNVRLDSGNISIHIYKIKNSILNVKFSKTLINMFK